MSRVYYPPTEEEPEVPVKYNEKVSNVPLRYFTNPQMVGSGSEVIYLDLDRDYDPDKLPSVTEEQLDNLKSEIANAELENDTKTEKAQPQDTQQYFEKVAAMIPSEVVAAYLFTIGIVPQISNQSLQQPFYVGLFLFFLIATPVYFYLTRDKKKSTPVWQMGIAFVAFFFWAYVTSGEVIVPNYYDAAIGTIFLGLFSFASGFIPLPTS